MKRNLFITMIAFISICFLAAPVFAVDVNLTSLGKTSDGTQTVWRFTNNTDSDQVVQLQTDSGGPGTIGTFVVPAGEYRTVYSPYATGSATHKAYNLSNGETATKASGSQIWTPSIDNIAFKNGVPVQEAERLLANGVLSNQAKNDEQDDRLDANDAYNEGQDAQIGANAAKNTQQDTRLNRQGALLLANTAVTAINHAEIYNTQDLNGDGLTDGDMNHVNGSQWPYSEIPVEEEPTPEIVLMAEPMNGAPMPPDGLYPPGTYYDNPEVPPTFELRNWVSCFESGDCDLGDHPLLQEPGPSRIDLNEAKNVEQDDRLDGHDELIGDIIEVQGLQAQDIEDQQDQLDNHEGRITTLEQDVAGLMDDVDRNKAGIAAAVATASLQFAPDHPGLQMAIGGGSYRGEQATALGIGGRLSKHVFVNANAGYTTEDDWTVGAGLTVLFSPAN